MTDEERLERLEFIQDHTQDLYDRILRGTISSAEARAGLEVLQLLADVVDLSDAITRRTQAASKSYGRR